MQIKKDHPGAKGQAPFIHLKSLLSKKNNAIQVSHNSSLNQEDQKISNIALKNGVEVVAMDNDEGGDTMGSGKLFL